MTWWTNQAPWLHVVPDESAVTAARALPPSGLIHVARMQGRAMTDADGVFTEFYNALRLPDYFGWNWNALRDCLLELNWIKADRYLLIVDDAESILSGSPGERETFFRILSEAATTWSAKPQFPGKAKSILSVVFLCPSETCEEFSKELAGIPGVQDC
ncbi:barstar family protein [Streptomyces sp. NPDC020681]|uniref:barstar family protein n=1 Tax=Streptomyces sp. NPDC020681 TaxID=3365083 RepID=UPI0037953BE4